MHPDPAIVRKMTKSDEPDDPSLRKSITLPESMWDEIDAYRKSSRITTGAEAVGRLLEDALKRARQPDKR